MKQPISAKLFDGVKFVDFKKRYAELGIEEHFKFGLKKDELIQRAVQLLADIEAKKAQGQDPEQATKDELLEAAKKEEQAQKAEAQKLKEQLEEKQREDQAKQKAEHKATQSYSESLKTVDSAVLQKALATTKANLKDASTVLRNALIKKQEAIENELQGRDS